MGVARREPFGRMVTTCGHDYVFDEVGYGGCTTRTVRAYGDDVWPGLVDELLLWLWHGGCTEAMGVARRLWGLHGGTGVARQAVGYGGCTEVLQEESVFDEV